MSERFFDTLARTLATPMARRRALRLAGAALVAATVPGVRPRPASARTSSGTPCESLCHSQDTTPHPLKPCGITGKNVYGETNCYMAGCIDPTVEKCCYIGTHSDTEPGVYVCPKDSRCGTVKTLAGGKSCITDCTRCGSDCCTEEEYCASPKRSLCCKAAGSGQQQEQPCLVPRSSKGTCCKPGTECKFSTTQAACCRPSQVLRNGKCACKDPKQKLCGRECCDEKSGEVCTNGTCCAKGKTGCGGTDCCEKREVCSKGKCCPQGQENCGGGGRCCAEADCCGETCCGKSQVCVGGSGSKSCCPRPRAFGEGKVGRCCPPRTYATDEGCCPSADPECCVAACLGDYTCVKGVCVKL